MPTADVRDARTHRILITGASGGLGTALVLHYAAPGRTLLLWGRNPERLEALAADCRAAGAQAIVRSLDLADSSASVAALLEDDDAGPIDLALLVAGQGDIQKGGELAEDPSQVMRLGLVNFVTPCAMASALAGRMAARQHGRIVMIGSVAAFHALPFAAAYAGSKAGLARFAQALRIGVAARGVHVTLVSPGFIDTAAGRQVAGPRPFLMRPADVAKRIAQASAQGQAHLVLPWPFAVARVLERLLPSQLRDRLLLGLTPQTK